MNNKPGKLFVVSAPSGAGKTSLVHALVETRSNVKVAISHTTRAMRSGETDGVNYFFVNKHQFSEREQAGEFVESATVFGNLYGTSSTEIDRILAQGHHLILEIDWQGAAQIRQQRPEVITIFILPPSIKALESRLESRAQDDKHTVAQRMRAAIDEISHFREFDYLVVNDDFDTALSDIINIVDNGDEALSLGSQLPRIRKIIDNLQPEV